MEMIRLMAKSVGVAILFYVTTTTVSAADSAMSAPSDIGTVIFYRPRAIKGAAIRFDIDQAGKPVGQLLNATKIESSLPSCNYQFSVRAPSVDGRDEVSINVEPGQTYYIKGGILWGWPAGRPKFTVMSEADAQSDLARMN